MNHVKGVNRDSIITNLNVEIFYEENDPQLIIGYDTCNDELITECISVVPTTTSQKMNCINKCCKTLNKEQQKVLFNIKMC